jgi:hypothetical protein
MKYLKILGVILLTLIISGFLATAWFFFELERQHANNLRLIEAERAYQRQQR